MFRIGDLQGGTANGRTAAKPRRGYEAAHSISSRFNVHPAPKPYIIQHPAQLRVSECFQVGCMVSA